MAGGVMPVIAGLSDNAAGMVDNVVAAVGDDAAHAVAGAVDTNPFALAPLVLDDVSVAATRADEAAGKIRSLIAQYGEGSLDDAAEVGSKDARISAFRVNKDGQGRLTKYVDEPSLVEPEVSSLINQADARLEDAGWQMARKPSPDGRFNGIDLPGSLRDSRDAIDILGQLAPKADPVAAAAV